MAGMFPTMVSDPDDRNRRFSGEVGPQWPRSLRIGYYLALAAAVLMLVIGFVSLANGVPDRLPDTWMIKGADEDLVERFASNLRIFAWSNIILGLVLSGAASYFSRGSKTARRVAGIVTACAVFVNLAGFFVGVAGWASIAVVVLLVFALFFAFRPDANAFVDTRSSDVWKGVE